MDEKGGYKKVDIDILQIEYEQALYSQKVQRSIPEYAVDQRTGTAGVTENKHEIRQDAPLSGKRKVALQQPDKTGDQKADHYMKSAGQAQAKHAVEPGILCVEHRIKIKEGPDNRYV